jgi:hypothetical protein
LGKSVKIVLNALDVNFYANFVAPARINGCLPSEKILATSMTRHTVF